MDNDNTNTALKQEDSKMMNHSSATVFIRNLPYNMTSIKLEEVFSDVGPLKSCFIVTEKGKQTGRGFAYVQYALREDAEKAIVQLQGHSFDGRRAKLDFANRRESKKERKSKEPSTNADVIEENPDDVDMISEKPTVMGDSDDGCDGYEDITDNTKNTTATTTTTSSPKKNKDKRSTKVPLLKDISTAGNEPLKPKHTTDKQHALTPNTLVISNLPEGVSKKKLLQRCKSSGRVDRSELVSSAMGSGSYTMYVEFRDQRDAKRAVARLAGFDVGGGRKAIASIGVAAKADLVAQAVRDKRAFNGLSENINVAVEQSSNLWKGSKKSRLILRNLSFKCNETELRNIFSKFGPLTDVSIATEKHTRKKRGYAFVQYTNVFDAAKAIKEMGMKEIHGRPVAIDWALPKNLYLEAQSKNDGASENDGDGEDDKSIVDDNEAGSGDEEELSENDDDEDEDEDEDDEDEDDEDEDDEHPDDVGENATVFVRNLSFDSTVPTICQKFAQFGKVQFAKIVMNPDTERSRGVAFVKFSTSVEAQKCIDFAETAKNKANATATHVGDKHSSGRNKMSSIALSSTNADGGGIVLDGRLLDIALAVDRVRAQELQEENLKRKEKETTDRRNLHLAKEGYVDPDSEAALSMSSEDKAKRDKSSQEKRAKLKNVNMFVSSTRLSIRNVPVSMDDASLRTKLIDALRKDIADHNENLAEGEELQRLGSPIKRVVIVRSKDRMDSTGERRSMGYAFAEFFSHETALRCLRLVNNNPAVFSPSRRPIIEFAVENQVALNIRSERLKKVHHKRDGRVNRDKDSSQLSDDSQQKKRKRPEDDETKAETKKTSKVKRTTKTETCSQATALVDNAKSYNNSKISKVDNGGGLSSSTNKKKRKRELDDAEALGNLINKEDSILEKKAKTAKKKQKSTPSEKLEDDRFENIVNKYKKHVFGDANDDNRTDCERLKSQVQRSAKRWFS